jgi:hypothetical protein
MAPTFSGVHPAGETVQFGDKAVSISRLRCSASLKSFSNAIGDAEWSDYGDYGDSITVLR